jgi:hypothetical protein
MARTRRSLNQVKCNDLESLFVQQKSIFPRSFLFQGFHHLAGSLSSRPRFLGFFEYFPPAHMPFSPGNRGVLKTCAHRTYLNFCGKRGFFSRILPFARFLRTQIRRLPVNIIVIADSPCSPIQCFDGKRLGKRGLLGTKDRTRMSLPANAR